MKKKNMNILAIIIIIAIILIFVLFATGSPFIKNMFSGTSEKACCTRSGGAWIADNCEDIVDVSGYYDCIQGSNSDVNN